MKYERRIPAQDVSAHRDPKNDLNIPSNRVFVYDVFDVDGTLVEDVPMPEDADLTDMHFPNDIITTSDPRTFVYRGMYWIDEDDNDIAVLRLGNLVRCPKFDWCLGHSFDLTGKELEELDGAGELHFGEPETLKQFTITPRTRQVYKVLSSREVTAEHDRVHVEIELEATFDSAGLRVLASELQEVAIALLEKAASPDLNVSSEGK